MPLKVKRNAIVRTESLLNLTGIHRAENESNIKCDTQHVSLLDLSDFLLITIRNLRLYLTGIYKALSAMNMLCIKPSRKSIMIHAMLFNYSPRH